MPRKPYQFFIIPERKIKEASLEMNGNYPYQGGGFVGHGIRSSSNKGDLQVFGDGRPTGSFSKTIRVQDGGSLGSSNWIWKDSDQTDHYYHGAPDIRALRDPHSPFSDTLQKAFGVTACAIPAYNREICIKISEETRNQLDIAYRDLDSSSARYGGGGWSLSTINFKDTFERGIDYSGVNSNSGQVDVTRMQDGTLVLSVRYQKDFDIYVSEDGLTWRLKTSGILSRFINQDPYPNTNDLPRSYGRLGLQYGMKIASSSDFLRIVFVSRDIAEDAMYIKVISSSDKGGTWSLVQDDTLTESGYLIGADRFGIDLVGLRNGQFMMSVNDQYYMSFRFYVGQGSGAFTYISSLTLLWDAYTSNGQAPRIYLCLDRIRYGA